MKIVANLIVIAVLAIFIYVIVSLLIRDAKNKKIKDTLLSNGVATQATITDVHSRSGGNSGFINITLNFSYVVENGKKIDNKADAVIDAMDTEKYQPGKEIPIRYLKDDVTKVFVDAPHPLNRKK